MPHIYKCDLTLLESTFFSSREVSDTYYTEPFLGNYALAYAMGFIQSPYFNDGTIHYGEHLSQMNERGIYITPATIDQPKFTFGQFNAQTDSYWSVTGKGVIVTVPNDETVAREEKGAWSLYRDGKKAGKISATNRPQFGRIRSLSINNHATAYVISTDPITIPHYIRLGKFMSKARIAVEEVSANIVDETALIPMLLNPADLPKQYTLSVFDLLNVPPTPLIRHAVLTGQFYKLAHDTYLPVDMRYGVEALHN